MFGSVNHVLFSVSRSSSSVFCCVALGGCVCVGVHVCVCVFSLPPSPPLFVGGGGG